MGKIVQCLLDVGMNPLQENKHGETPLRSAAERGHLDVVQLLVLTLLAYKRASSSSSSFTSSTTTTATPITATTNTTTTTISLPTTTTIITTTTAGRGERKRNMPWLSYQEEH